VPDPVRITEVNLTASSPGDRATGLLGYVAATLNGTVRLDGLILRRTASGQLALSFPARRDARGNQHPYVRPVDDASRRDIEHQIFTALGLGETVGG
jgi:hypothetical protein